MLKDDAAWVPGSAELDGASTAISAWDLERRQLQAENQKLRNLLAAYRGMLLNLVLPACERAGVEPEVIERVKRAIGTGGK